MLAVGSMFTQQRKLRSEALIQRLGSTNKVCDGADKQFQSYFSVLNIRTSTATTHFSGIQNRSDFPRRKPPTAGFRCHS